MATFSKISLTGRSLGRGIKVDATTSPGTIIHEGSTNVSVTDEVWLYAINTHTSTIKLTVEYGGTSDPDDIIEVNILPESGLVLVVPGFILKGDNTGGVGLRVRAFAATGNKISIFGYVNRIS
jgi:hypothetical protein